MRRVVPNNQIDFYLKPVVVEWIIALLWESELMVLCRNADNYRVIVPWRRK